MLAPLGSMVVLVPCKQFFGRLYKRFHALHQVKIKLFTKGDISRWADHAGLELIVGDNKSLVDGLAFEYGTGLKDCFIEALQQDIVDGIHSLCGAVVTLHELFDRELIAVPEVQLLRQFLLMLKQQSVFVAASEKMQCKSDLQQVLFCGLQVVLLGFCRQATA